MYRVHHKYIALFSSSSSTLLHHHHHVCMYVRTMYHLIPRVFRTRTVYFKPFVNTSTQTYQQTQREIEYVSNYTRHVITFYIRTSYGIYTSMAVLLSHHPVRGLLNISHIHLCRLLKRLLQSNKKIHLYINNKYCNITTLHNICITE